MYAQQIKFNTLVLFKLSSCRRKLDRNKAIKLLLKIYKNIMNNPTEMKKYGDLHSGKINKKLSKCKPAFDLLLLSGFRKANNDTRLIWTSNNNDSNVMLLKHIQNQLKSILDDDNSNNIDSNESKQAEPVTTQQMQQVCYKIQHDHCFRFE